MVPASPRQRSRFFFGLTVGFIEKTQQSAQPQARQELGHVHVQLVNAF